MSYEPHLEDPGVCNVYEEHTYKVRVLMGSSVITSYRSKDATIVRNSAGNYTITLPKPYEELTEFRGNFVDASGAILFPVVRTNNISTAGTLVVETVTETGTATDPTAGDTVVFVVCASSNILNTKFTG